MRRSSRYWIPVLSVIASLLTGCVAPPSLYDYTALENNRPRSILVIPPANNSIEVNGSYTFLATISRPLAEKGYYVFPVAVIDHFLKENGLPTPAEMNGIPLDKIEEHIGADAVLYVSIEDWGQKYRVLTSTTVVHSTLRLVDVKTGDLLWETTVKAARNSDDGDLGLLGAIVIAITTQVAGSVSDKTPQLSSYANYLAIHNNSNGLLHGPYFNPDGGAKWNTPTAKVRNSPAEEAELLFMGKAAGEIAAKSYDEKLWAKALVTAEGDEQKRKGVYIKLRSKQLAEEKEKAEEIAMLSATGEKSVAYGDISGTYISEITSDSQFILKEKYQNLKLVLRQRENEITGTSVADGVKIYGTITEDVIKFNVSSTSWKVTGGYDLEGSWRVSSDGKRLIGKWSMRRYGSGGKWNLTRIE